MFSSTNLKDTSVPTLAPPYCPYLQVQLFSLIIHSSPRAWNLTISLLPQLDLYYSKFSHCLLVLSILTAMYVSTIFTCHSSILIHSIWFIIVIHKLFPDLMHLSHTLISISIIITSGIISSHIPFAGSHSNNSYHI